MSYSMKKLKNPTKKLDFSKYTPEKEKKDNIPKLNLQLSVVQEKMISSAREA